MGIVYKVTSKTTGKSYIGATSLSLNVRKALHIHRMHSDRTAPFYEALRGYGRKDFTWTVLREVENSYDLQEQEDWFIRELKTLVPNGYNAYFGRNNALSAESREKISLRRAGKSASRESRLKQAKSKGRPVKCLNNSIVYPSIVQAHLNTGVTCRYISNFCDGNWLKRSKYADWKFTWSSKEKVTVEPLL